MDVQRLVGTLVLLLCGAATGVALAVYATPAPVNAPTLAMPQAPLASPPSIVAPASPSPAPEGDVSSATGAGIPAAAPSGGG